ncbi:MAG: SGNH/GDSL hydrolase family protein [Gemmatimonadales bacterium]
MSPRDRPTFLALGDSYTIGEGVDPADRWPVQLVRLLRTRGLDVADPDIIARTGWTTGELAAGIAVAAPAGPYGLVSLLIGVNNQYRGEAARRYREDLRTLLLRGVAYADGRAGRVVVFSIPDWGVTPFAAGRDRARIAAEIDSFNTVGREEARLAGAHFVDVTPVSREAHEGWVTADGLHPSGRQYAKWAELAQEAAGLALGN